MLTPLEKRKTYHKTIMSFKKEHETKDKAHIEADISIKKDQDRINRIKNSIDEIEAKFGITSIEADNFRKANEPKILELEKEISNLEGDRKNNKKASIDALNNKINSQLLRNKQEKIDGVPKYTEKIPKIGGRFFDYPIDWIKKSIRKFKEDLSTKIQKRSAALAAFSALVGIVGYENKDKIKNYINENIKDSIENLKKENVNNKKDTIKIEKKIEKKIENTQEIKDLGIRFKNGIQYKEISPNNWEKSDIQYDFSKNGIESSKDLRDDLYIRSDEIDGAVKLRYYYKNGDLYTGSADELYK